MSTITCSSCGMEYDGTGLQAGVQFQCTQCGSMVQVGAAAAPAARGPVKRKTGRTRMAAGGPPARGPARAPARGAGRAAPAAAGQADEQQQGYGPPVKKGGNAGLIVGLVVGGIVLVLIVVVVVMSSGPSGNPDQAAKDADAAKHAARKKELEDEDAKRLAEKQAFEKTYNAVYAQGPAIEAAIKSGNAATIEAMFDWQAFALYTDGRVSTDPAAHLKSKDAPLLCVGEWEKNAEGVYTGIFLGKAPHGADGLKERVMYYIKEFYFGATHVRYMEDRTKAHEGMKVTIKGGEYLAKPVYISMKEGDKEKEFWVGAPKGSDAVRIINFIDKGSFTNLQGIEAKKVRGGDRDPYNPERDPRDPRDPKDPEDPDNPPADPDGDLPEAVKTGQMPKNAPLLNAIDDLKRGQKLNQARIKAIETEPSKVEKKATMGALIDLLIDAVKSNDRSGKNYISLALYEVWQPFVPEGWTKDHMVYTIDFNGQSETDLVVRRWLDIYNAYKTE